MHPDFDELAIFFNINVGTKCKYFKKYYVGQT